MAPRLFDTSNPQNILDFIDEIARKSSEIRARRDAARRTGGLLGSFVGSNVGAGY